MSHDHPKPDRLYRLTGGPDEPSILRGDSWAESEVPRPTGEPCGICGALTTRRPHRTFPGQLRTCKRCASAPYEIFSESGRRQARRCFDEAVEVAQALHEETGQTWTVFQHGEQLAEVDSTGTVYVAAACRRRGHWREVW